MIKAEATVEELDSKIERGELRLTSLSAVIRGQPVQVNGRVRPIELLFNLEHPEALTFVTECEAGREAGRQGGRQCRWGCKDRLSPDSRW